jgi:predicted RNA binding protein YcfA (HicA-like mRNA interferase family)
LKPISRRELIRRLIKLGFRGPYPGGNHSYMIHETKRLQIPNPHRGDISVSLLKEILRQGGITETEWNSVK